MERLGPASGGNSKMLFGITIEMPVTNGCHSPVAAWTTWCTSRKSALWLAGCRKRRAPRQLSPQQQREAIMRLKTGERASSIAAAYGVGVAEVARLTR